MKKELTAFIGQLKSGKKLKGFDEASTKQGVVLKLLSLLGWDVFDVEEVCPDFVVDVYSVSYALRIDARNRVLVAVRSAQEKLEGQQNELLLCAAQAGVDLRLSLIHI